MTIQDLIRELEKWTPGGPKPDTNDTVKYGDPAQELTGVVTTFMATADVLKRCQGTGANLIITHEPTFYNGSDETPWLEKSPVYQAKVKLIRETNAVIWRFHDGMHIVQPDAILAGVKEELGWTSSAENELLFKFQPARSASALAKVCQERLKIGTLKIAGDPETTCARVGLMVGAWGGRRQIELMIEHDLDALLVGESPEWETCEYVRDSSDLGRPRALIVLGHANSEEAGMSWLARELRPLVPSHLPIVHLPALDPFRFLMP